MSRPILPHCYECSGARAVPALERSGYEPCPVCMPRRSHWGYWALAAVVLGGAFIGAFDYGVNAQCTRVKQDRTSPAYVVATYCKDGASK